MSDLCDHCYKKVCEKLQTIAIHLVVYGLVVGTLLMWKADQLGGGTLNWSLSSFLNRKIKMSNVCVHVVCGKETKCNPKEVSIRQGHVGNCQKCFFAWRFSRSATHTLVSACCQATPVDYLEPLHWFADTHSQLWRQQGCISLPANRGLNLVCVQEKEAESKLTFLVQKYSSRKSIFPFLHSSHGRKE